MSEPQTEDGFTRIANELLEAITLHKFSKREYKVVLSVIRKTYGFNKKADDMSLSQISDLTGLDRSNICRTVNSLTAKKVLSKRQGKYGQVIGLNKKYKEWRCCHINNSCQNNNSIVVKTTTEVLSKQPIQKTTPKDNSKRHTVIYPDWLDVDVWNDYVVFRKKIRVPLTDRAITLAINKLKKLRREGNNPTEVIEESILNGWKGLFPLKNSSEKEPAYGEGGI